MIYAVIVTFNPVLANLNNLVQALQTNEVTPVVVDNASSSPFSVACHKIDLEKNFGIAKAQNTGIDFVLEKGAKTIVFFDQDSTITDEFFIKKLYEPIYAGETQITAPVFIDDALRFIYSIVEITDKGGRIKHYPEADDPERMVNNVISSGTMVDAEALKDIGNMTEELFIDYVDTEWCMRAYSKGYRMLVIPSARMVHTIGDKTLKFFGYYVPKHSPFRRYYRIRNSFYLLRLPYIPLVMAIREILFSIIHQFILIIISKGERTAYIKSLVKGLRDGFLGRFG